MINFASGYEIVKLQDSIIFAGVPSSTPLAFLDFDLEMKVHCIYILRGDGTEIKSDRSRAGGSYCLDAGMVYYVFRDRFSCYVLDDIYIEPATVIWSDII